MQIGLMSRLVVDDSITLEQVIGDITDAEARGLAFYALPHAFHVDAVITLAIAGRRTAAIELMTGVVPIQPRHPHALAQQALTAQLVCEGRFTLGIGLSHAVMMRDMLGLSYEHPAQQMREYLAVLEPLLALSKASAQGEFYQANARLRIPQACPVDVLVAALGPLMLDVAGQYAQGTFTWMTGARTLSALTVPRLAAAAKAASRLRSSPTPKSRGNERDLSSSSTAVSRLTGTCWIAKAWSMPETWRCLATKERSNGLCNRSLMPV